MLHIPKAWLLDVTATIPDPATTYHGRSFRDCCRLLETIDPLIRHNARTHNVHFARNNFTVVHPLPPRGGVLAFGWGIRSQFFPRILGFGVFVSGNHTAALNVKYVRKIQSLSPDYTVVSGPNQLSRAWYNSLSWMHRKERLSQKFIVKSFDMSGF